MDSAGSSSENIHWHCPACFDRYSAGQGNPNRTTLVGARYDADDCFAAYIGHLSDHYDNRTLAKELGGSKITVELILRTILFLNEHCGHALSRLAMMRALFAADGARHDKYYD